MKAIMKWLLSQLEELCRFLFSPSTVDIDSGHHGDHDVVGVTPSPTAPGQFVDPATGNDADAVALSHPHNKSVPMSAEAMETLLAKVRHFVSAYGKNPNLYNFRFIESEGDWSLRSADGITVEFNSRYATLSSEAYFETIIIHEMVHFLHGMPNNEDAKLLRSIYGDVVLRAIDIEADLETFRFLKEYDEITYSDFLELLYEGQSVFRSDAHAFPGKVERWLGTALSTYCFDTSGERHVLVPIIGGIALNAKLLLVTMGDHPIHFSQVHVATSTLSEIYQLYQHGHEYHVDEYCEQVTTIVQNIFFQVSNI